MKNFLLKAFSILILIGLPITFIGCGSSDHSTNLNNSNAKADDVAYQESPVVKPIINIHAIANKTVDEVKEILGNANSSEMTKYGIKNTYSDGKIEILFVQDVAMRITVESDDGNPELLGINKESIKNLPSKNRNEVASIITYNNLEGLYSIHYDKMECFFQILTKKELIDIFKSYSLNDLINNKVDNNINDEQDFANQYYEKLNNIILKYDKNYSVNYYNELDLLLNEIYSLLKKDTDKEVFAKIEKQEIEWINYKESKNNLQEKIYDTEMRIRDLLHIMETMQAYDVMNKYIPYFKAESNNSIKSKTNNSVGYKIVLSEIPDVLGLDVETAKNLLNNSHLKCSIKEDSVDEEKYDGKVLSQSIEAKSQVAEWSTITITVGKYVNIPQ